jgi:hypothetical protein
LNVVRGQGQIRGILIIWGGEVINIQFAIYSLLSLEVDGVLDYLDTFFYEIGAMVSDSKTKFWLVDTKINYLG